MTEWITTDDSPSTENHAKEVVTFDGVICVLRTRWVILTTRRYSRGDEFLPEPDHQKERCHQNLHLFAFLANEEKSSGISRFGSCSFRRARTTTRELFGSRLIDSRVAWRSWRVTRCLVTEPPMARETMKPTFGDVNSGSLSKYPTRVLVLDLIGDFVTRVKSS